MQQSKNNGLNAMGWIAGITAAVLLVGIVGCRKASPPATLKPAATSAVAPDAATTADDNVIFKENFETLDSGKWPTGWRGWESGKTTKMKLGEEAKHHFLEFSASNVFSMRLSRIVPCQTNFHAYEFSARVRVQDMTPRKGQIRGATLGIEWLDASGKYLAASDLDYLTEPGDWRVLQGVYQAPPNAASMRIFPLLTRCGGTVDFEDVTIKGVDPEPEKEVYEEYFDKVTKPEEVKRWNWYATNPDESLVIKGESSTNFVEYTAKADGELRRFGSVEIPLDPSWTKIRFSARVRGVDLKTDSTQAVAGMCILGYWKGEGNNNATPYRVQTEAVRNSDEWKRLDVEREIPAGAKSLELNLMFLYASGGVDVRAIKVTVPQ